MESTDQEMLHRNALDEARQGKGDDFKNPAPMEYADQEALRKNALDEARQEKRDDSKNPAPPESASKQPIIDVSSDIPFLISISLAALKDLLDYVGIGSFPLIGTAITFIFMIAIAMLIFLADIKHFFSNLMMLITGSGVEAFLFGLNFLPFLTAAALAIYIRTIIRRRSASAPFGSAVQKILK